jgi:hypothetical protein
MKRFRTVLSTSICAATSWRAHGQLQNQRTWLIENTLVERSDGAVLMLFRTKIGVLWKSLSYDKGRTWAGAYTRPLFIST